MAQNEGKFVKERGMVAASCEIRQRFRACGEPRVGVCQYCGRDFCAKHGERLADGQEICERSTCQKKKSDLERHLVYKASVAERNGGRRCGADGCDRTPNGQCSKCSGLFCGAHLQAGAVEQRQGATVVRVRGALCKHCRKRQLVWKGS